MTRGKANALEERIEESMVKRKIVLARFPGAAAGTHRTGALDARSGKMLQPALTYQGPP